jgi:hypothetical protein
LAVIGMPCSGPLMQLLPFADPKALALLEQFERAVYASLAQ